MISKNLFFKLVRQDFRKRIWCPILIFITYFLCMEVYLLSCLEELTRNPGAFSYDAAAFVKNNFFGTNADEMAAVACFAAFMCGISGFAYLYSKVQLDVYHSLPVSRTKLFWSKYLSGFLQFFLPFVTHSLICAGIAAGRNAFGLETVFAMLSYISLQLVVFVLVYGVTVIAVELTGNLIVGIMGTGILFCYSTIISFLMQVLFDRFFQTYTVYGKCVVIPLTFSEKVWCFSPLSMLLKLFSQERNLTMEEAAKIFTYDHTYIGVLAVAAAVYSLAAFRIYLKRASEAAGKSIAFGAAEPVIKTMVVIPVSFFSAAFFTEIAYDRHSDHWFVFGLVFGFLLSCILMEVIFRLDIRGALMHKKQFLFNAVCTALIFVVLRYDVTGYDTYVPSDAQIQSCAVSIQDLIPLSQNYLFDTSRMYYRQSDEYCMANMALQGNPSVMELARKAAAEQLTYQYIDYYEGIEGSPEYIALVDRQANYREIVYGYKLLNGQTIYRSYIIDLADEDTLRLLSDIFGDSDYKLGATPLFNEEWDVTLDMLQCENHFVQKEIALTPEMQENLIKTYQKEYVALSLDTVMQVIPSGTIDFARSVQGHGHSRGYTSYCGEMPVYPQFSETIALLKEYGFDMEKKLMAADVESIRVQKHAAAAVTDEYYVGTPVDTAQPLDSGWDIPADAAKEESVKYTQAQIQQILDNVVSEGVCSWKMNQFAGYIDDLYTIDIRYHTQDGTNSNYRFIKGQIPAFIE